MALLKRASLQLVSTNFPTQISPLGFIPGFITTRELDSTWVRAPSTCNLNLEAGHIRLRLACSSMQRNRFSSDKIITRSQRLRNRKSALPAVCVKNLSSPGGSCTRVSVFGDLEEGAGGGGFGVRDLRHVDQDG